MLFASFDSKSPFEACSYVEYVLPNIMLVSIALIFFLSIFMLRSK